MNVSIHFTPADIAHIIRASNLIQDENIYLEYLLLDSRKLLTPKTTIFFNLNKTVASKKIIQELYEKGVTNFVVDEAPDVIEFPNANFLIVENTLSALQQLAGYYRSQFNIPVIGITGSNGKTIVKEWLFQLLHKDFHIARSPKSYNSQIGVPLSILQLNDQSTLGIFEAGISTTNEMAALGNIIKPTIGIITNIGDAHNEGFENEEEKIKEKLKLFHNSDVLVYCKDYELLDRLVREIYSHGPRLFSWSKSDAAVLEINSIRKEDDNTILTGKYGDKESTIKIPFVDEASIENAISCWCTMLNLGLGQDTIYERMLQLQPVEMRLELKHGINNTSIINDSYSADYHSLQIALDFLLQQKQYASFTVILSDIAQSGLDPTTLYQQIAHLLISKNIQRLIAIGPEITHHARYFESIPKTVFFLSVDAFKKEFHTIDFNNEAILIKGARIYEFEQISKLLEQKIHQTILSIDLSAVAHNFKQYKKLLDPTTQVMAMVKAFGYGSGAYEIARVLQYNKADYLAVAYADEGVSLRKAGITLPIMVMNPEADSFSNIVQYFLEPEIFSFDILNDFTQYLNGQGVAQYPVHIKIDTGMHRLGFAPEEIIDLAESLNTHTLVKVQSVFSHLIASNDSGKEALTRHQYSIFMQCCEILSEKLRYDFIKHIANTAAISYYPDLQLNMVRTGIGIYGIDTHSAMQSKLKTVGKLITTIAQIKKVKAGETVGYGGNIILTESKVIATIRIGYADGYPRSFGNGVGKVLIRGRLAPVIGSVCMDMTMIDISDIPSVQIYDTVEIFGDQLRVDTLSKWIGTIPYEIMTNISQRVNRVYFEE